MLYYHFFKRLQRRYGRKPYSDTQRDGVRWYNEAYRWLRLRLRHYIYRTELKKENLMERFIQQLKDRTECFDDYFPMLKKADCSRQHIWDWLKLSLLCLHMGTDRRRFTLFLARDGG